MSPSLFLLLLSSFAVVSRLAKAKQITDDIIGKQQRSALNYSVYCNSFLPCREKEAERDSRSSLSEAFSFPDGVAEGAGAGVARAWVPTRQNVWTVFYGPQEKLFYYSDPARLMLQALGGGVWDDGNDIKISKDDRNGVNRESGDKKSESGKRRGGRIPHEGILSSRRVTFEELLGISDPLRRISSENEAYVQRIHDPENSLDTFSNKRKSVTITNNRRNILRDDKEHSKASRVISDSNSSAPSETQSHATGNTNTKDSDNRNSNQSKNNESSGSGGSSSKRGSPPRAFQRRRRDLPPNSKNIPKPLSMPGLILAHGYPAEVHHVTTEDGYILELHRIPGPRMVDASPKKKRRSGRSTGNSSEKRAQRVLEDEKLRALLEGLDGNTVLSVENLQGMSAILNGFYEESDNQDLLRDKKSFHRKTRFKRSDFRRQMARNRQLIRTVDPMVLIQRSRLSRPSQYSNMRYVRRPNRHFPAANPLPRRQQFLRRPQPSVEVNAKRSISRATLGIDSHEAGHHLNNFVNSDNSQNDDKDREVKDLIRDTGCLDSSSPCKSKGSSSFNSPSKQGTNTNNHNHVFNHNNIHKPANITQLSPLKHVSSVKKKVVFVQHCLQCSSADFVLNDHNQALGFILADAGYDVWLGNFRGNQYSRRHTTLSPSNVEYWKFKVDDLARYDIPAMIFHVLKVTKSDDLYYIGHSLGTMTFFMATSTNPVVLSKIRLMIALAPSGYLDHMRGGLKFMLKSAQSFYRLMEAFGIGEVGGVLPWRGGFMRRFCKPESPLVGVCSSLLPAVSGRNNGLHDKEYLPLLLANFPAGTSFRLMAQIGQIIGSDGIRMFDFGNVAENTQHYGSNTPPHYPLEKITCPVAIMWAENDYIVTPLDVSRAARRLPNVVLNYKVPHHSFNHVDFLFADIARGLVYEPILNLLSRY